MHQYILGVSSHELIFCTEQYLTQLRIDNWFNHDLFSWQWWVLVIVLIVPWFIWWRYVDRERLLEITLLGMFTLIISSYLDAVFTELGLWDYHFWVIPLWPRLIPADFTIIPVTFMFVYQKFRSWNEFLIAMIFVAAIFAFIGETFLVWIDIYELHGWKHIYSFPIYFALGVIVRWLALTLAVRQDTAKIL